MEAAWCHLRFSINHQMDFLTLSCLNRLMIEWRANPICERNLCVFVFVSMETSLAVCTTRHWIFEDNLSHSISYKEREDGDDEWIIIIDHRREMDESSCPNSVVVCQLKFLRDDQSKRRCKMMMIAKYITTLGYSLSIDWFFGHCRCIIRHSDMSHDAWNDTE